jgi:hypothetical protein
MEASFGRCDSIETRLHLLEASRLGLEGRQESTQLARRLAEA